jgi:hypothetical protein
MGAIGGYEFNFSAGETMRYHFPRWLTFEEIMHFITEYPKNRRSGDIYARLVTES